MTPPSILTFPASLSLASTKTYVFKVVVEPDEAYPPGSARAAGRHDPHRASPGPLDARRGGRPPQRETRLTSRRAMRQK